MKKLGFIALLCWFCLCTYAAVDATAVALLDKTSNIYKQSTGTELTLRISIDDAQSGQSQTVNGTLKTRDKRFVLSTSFATMNFDGKTLYIYQPDVNEITISQPATEELDDIDPTQIITTYNSGFQIPAPEYSQENGKEIATVNLFPEDRNEDYFKLSIKIDTQTHCPIQISTHGKNGMVNTIDIINLKTNQNFSDKELDFNLKDYPKAQIIDIR